MTLTLQTAIIIPTRNQYEVLARCTESIMATTSDIPLDILIVNNRTDCKTTLGHLHNLQTDQQVRILHFNNPFNFSAMNNLAAQAASASILVFLNNDTEVISPGWLTELGNLAADPQNGAVGAMLYYPNNTIQHAGIQVGGGTIARNMFAGKPRGYIDPDGYLKDRQVVDAVTAACMAIRRNLFLEIGGFDETNLPVNFNDVDLCLRLKEKGYRNIWTPFAELYHHESATRKPERRLFKSRRFKHEINYMMQRWPQLA